MKNHLKNQQNKGITLVALVVTIVVLLILAGVSLNLVIGNNGIITKAKDAKEKSKMAEARTQVDLGMADWQVVKRTQNKTFEAHLKDTFGNENVTANGDNFDVKVKVDDEYTFTFTVKDDGETSAKDPNAKEPIPEGVYSIAGVEPSPMDLFNFEPISTTTGKLASTELSGLPEKKARITGMNAKYCNDKSYSYNEDGKDVTAPDTNYEIKYNGSTISDTLVIPYKVLIEGEYYTVTEVDLRAYGSTGSDGVAWGLPEVNTVILPNTVTSMKFSINNLSNPGVAKWKMLILSNKLETIQSNENGVMWSAVPSKIWVPKNLQSCSNKAIKPFNGGYPTIMYEGSEAEWNAANYGLDEGINVQFNCPAPTAIPVTK